MDKNFTPLRKPVKNMEPIKLPVPTVHRLSGITVGCLVAASGKPVIVENVSEGYINLEPETETTLEYYISIDELTGIKVVPEMLVPLGFVMQQKEKQYYYEHPCGMVLEVHNGNFCLPGHMDTPLNYIHEVQTICSTLFHHDLKIALT